MAEWGSGRTGDWRWRCAADVCLSGGGRGDAFGGDCGAGGRVHASGNREGRWRGGSVAERAWSDGVWAGGAAWGPAAPALPSGRGGAGRQVRGPTRGGAGWGG